MKILIKFFPILVIIFSVFFINTQKVQAACDYQITRFDPQGATTAVDSGVLSYQVNIARSGDYALCEASDPIYRFEVKIKNGWSTLQTKTDLSFVSGKTATTFGLDLSKFNRNILEQPNKIDARFSIVYSGNVVISNIWTTQVTAIASGSGNLIPKIRFNPGNSSFKKDEKIQVFISADKAAVNSLSSGISNINIRTEVNDVKIGEFNVVRGALETTTQYQNVTIGQSNSFKDGVNTIKVSFWESGSSVKLGESTATLTVSGIGATAVDPGLGGGGGAASTTNSTSANSGGMQNNSNNKLFNPLPESDLQSAFLLVLQGLLGMLGMLATVFVVVGGVQMVLAAGNEEGITKAKKTITWAVIGLIAAMLSFSIIAIVQELLKADLAPASTNNQTK